MTSNILLISNYMMLVGLVTQLILLTLQWRTYQKTGHSSLRLIAISTIFGLLNIAILFGARKFWASGHDPSALYLISACFLTVQSLAGIVGVWSLFRAFEHVSSKSMSQ